MAAAAAAAKWMISSRTILRHIFPIQNGALSCACRKSTYSPLPDDYNCKVELALTSDGRTIVCYHPSLDIPYEHTKGLPVVPLVEQAGFDHTEVHLPLPPEHWIKDPLHNNEETHDQVLKTKLEEKSERLEQGPMIEQLSKMFFTTKHRWYPYGQYHRRRKKLNPPKDR